jgi:protocatechuate 3,4-dioxygenase beta subunit
VAETSTDAAGQYRFENLPPGEYTVREIHPRGWLDGQDSPGTVNGAARGEALNPGDEIQHIFLQWSDVGRDFNFAELQPASLSGRVHSSRLEDCWNDPAAEPLAGVNILLIDDRGRTVAETTTDAAGRYRFVDVAPGRFSVQEIQPAGVFQGSQRAGSGGGEVDVDDLISNVLVDPGAELTGYDFCELPPSTLSGFVFQDGEAILLAPEETPPEDLSAVRDGVLTADDTRLAGVVLELRRGITGEPVLADEALAGVYPQGPIQTVTDEDGYYEFTGLPKGNYAVYELQPEGYLDGIDTPGTTDGIAINPRVADEGDIFLETVVSMLVEPPRNDAIVRIGLPPGVVSMQNNFSEVTARTARYHRRFPCPRESPPRRPRKCPMTPTAGRRSVPTPGT